MAWLLGYGQGVGGEGGTGKSGLISKVEQKNEESETESSIKERRRCIVEDESRAGILCSGPAIVQNVKGL